MDSSLFCAGVCLRTHQVNRHIRLVAYHPTVVSRRNVKHVPGLHLDHAAIIHRGRRTPGNYHPYVLHRSSLFLPRARRVPTISILVRRSRARWSFLPLALPQICPSQTCESRRAAQIASGLPRAWVFPFSTFGKQRFHAGFSVALYGFVLSASYEIGWRLAKMPERSGAEPRAAKKAAAETAWR